MLTITGKPQLAETRWSVRPGSEEKKMRYLIEVRLPNGDIKDTTLNNTSSNALLSIFGPNENDWLNKEIIVEKRYQKVHSEDKYVLYFRAANKTVQQYLLRKPSETTETQKMTLEEALEKVRDWPEDLATGFIDHLRSTGRLDEGGP